MTSKDERLNEMLRFAKVYNTISGKRLTQLEVLKVYLKLEKTV